MSTTDKGKDGRGGSGSGVLDLYDTQIRPRIKRMLDPDIKLRRRMIQLLSTIALAEFVIVTVYTVASGSDPAHIALMIAGTVAFTVTVAFTFRTGHIREGAAISGFLYFLLYPLTFFQSGGMYGGAPVTVVLAFVYVFLVTQKWERIALLLLCGYITAGCFMLAYFHPEMLDRHTVLAEHVESFLSIALVVTLICLLFTFMTGVYITENRIVQRQKKEIEDLNSAQKRFFSSMSHEIRTPVNAVIGLNEMNMREDVPDEVLENSKNIEVAGKILLHTINEIMDMSRLETGTMEILSAEYRTTAMLSDIVGMTWLSAKEKGLEFEVDVDPEVPSKLYGDEVRIKQILLNVVTNAVKYTHEGSVVLRISGHPADDGLYMMEYDVADTGIGIREESIPYLFSSFQRMDDEKTHAIEGTGLGLSIVKQLLDLMGGSVTVTSEYGKGSDFHIEIPQKVVDASPVGKVDDLTGDEVKAAPAEKSGAAGESKGGVAPAAADDEQDKIGQESDAGEEALVLAVDDTPMNLTVIKKMLRDLPVQLDTAKSGEEALRLTAEKQYEVVLMDHQMPGMDGIECLKRMRTQEGGKSRDAKVVCLTANAGGDMKKMYMDAGFDGYMEKPVRRAMLEETLNDMLNQRRI